MFSNKDVRKGSINQGSAGRLNQLLIQSRNNDTILTVISEISEPQQNILYTRVDCIRKNRCTRIIDPIIFHDASFFFDQSSRPLLIFKFLELNLTLDFIRIFIDENGYVGSITERSITSTAAYRAHGIFEKFRTDTDENWIWYFQRFTDHLGPKHFSVNLDLNLGFDVHNW